MPIVDDFWRGVAAEKEHQTRRWGTTHDRNKEPADWFWLVGYLSGKALASAVKGDREKALHHTISSAAVLAQWHDALSHEHDPSRPSDLEKHLSLKVEHDPSRAAGEALAASDTKSVERGSK